MTPFQNGRDKANKYLNNQNLLAKIKRASSPKKDELYTSIYGNDRKQLLEKAILSLPSGYRTLPVLQSEIQSIYGVYAGIDVNERLLRGLASLHDDKVQVSFTLGLNQIHIGRRNK